MMKKVVSVPCTELAEKMRYLVYKQLDVEPITSYSLSELFTCCIKLLLNVKDEIDRSSDFLSALGLFLREIQLAPHHDTDDVSFEDFCKMASQLNGIPVKLCSRLEKLTIIKMLSGFVNDTQLKDVDRIKYCIVTATTHRLESSDDGLKKQLKLDPKLVEMFQSLNRKDQLSIFNVCVEYGRSDSEWVADRVSLTLTNIQEALEFAAKKGHLDVLKFLVDRFELTADDARDDNNAALGGAASNGHLDVLKLLVDRFELTADDARADNNAMLRAASNGHLDVLKFLVDRFELTADDARAEDNYALEGAAGNGHLDVLKWLVETFDLTADDARADNNYALRGMQAMDIWMC